jgi:hypothetical protein
MRHQPLVVAAAVCAAWATAACGQETAEAKCGSFVLVGGEKSVTVVDNLPAGTSAGDVRAGRRMLMDANGNPVGEVHFVATVTVPGTSDSGDFLVSQYFVLLEDGWLSSSSIYQLPNAADTSQRAGNATLVVTGGTGPYADATGTIVIEAGDAPRYVFDIHCK